MPDTTAPSTPRIVPGAPPPPPLSKSQKKKRKTGKSKEESETGSHVAVPDPTTAALIEKAPDESDVKGGVVAPQLVAQPSEAPSLDIKPSPVVDLLNKRIKANNKKIIRIQAYQNDPPEKLNEDQKRTLKTLPILEAVSKELEEVKKAVEIHEAELAQEIAFQKAEAARTEAERIREAVAAAEAEHLKNAAELVSFVRLHLLLANSTHEALALNLSEEENTAIFSLTEYLLRESSGEKEDIIRNMYTGNGEYLGVPFSRIQEIQNRFLFPPPPEARSVDVDVTLEETAAPVPEPSLSVGVPHTIAIPGGIHFILTDELAETETEPEAEFGVHSGSGDWVNVDSTPEVDQPAEVEITEAVVEAEVNGHHVVEESVTVTTTTELNWADEDQGELPSLANLQAHYRTSGEASPVPEAEPLPETPSTPQMNGDVRAVDEDGFTQLRGRGRGRGHRGGERGSRGGYRGRYRGEHSERGGHRGDHGERGGLGFRGDHGERGGFRGEHGERGGYRGEHGEPWGSPR
ncbi:hypothetical protein C8Q80DRAFT_860101 [Daedaleopsis nitida]|nr:hypothetical protein C8Q80DRAFT_860101 [Daedaleopsis nitida]